jgi:hypothetical protein
LHRASGGLRCARAQPKILCTAEVYAALILPDLSGLLRGGWNAQIQDIISPALIYELIRRQAEASVQNCRGILAGQEEDDQKGRRRWRTAEEGTGLRAQVERDGRMMRR